MRVLIAAFFILAGNMINNNKIRRITGVLLTLSYVLLCTFNII